MSTIKEVADLAGVSIGTVSHVLTGSLPVSPRLRTKVEAAIRELDYHPNHVARSLKTSKTRTLGIIVPDMTIPFFPRIIRGAESAARQRNYSLVAVNSDESVRRQRELLSLLRSQRVEGILVVAGALSDPLDQISRTMDSGIPMVCVDRLPAQLEIDSVAVENSAAAELGVNHLISMGHRSIAIVTGPLTLRNEEERLQGYQQALRKAGFTVVKELIWEGNFHVEEVAAICRERLRGSSPRPGALFATNGPAGLGALRALRDCGLRTPQDLGFVTFDELTVDDLFTPSVTTVVQPAHEIGVRAAEILLKRIGEGWSADKAPITVRLPATLQIRESSQFVAQAPGLRTASS
jgi:DNA-binding LacI/PurR family transcriptional regulator